MPLRDGHQGQAQVLKEVGLHGSLVQTTQGSREQSLGTSVRLGADPFVGGGASDDSLFTVVNLS